MKGTLPAPRRTKKNAEYKRDSGAKKRRSVAHKKGILYFYVEFHHRRKHRVMAVH
jgi:hypothetical protein